ncbi:MAG: thiamine pyrophosphate-dependent dehydrogenase E1 component subunit alpha [Pseudomonadales bacterium]|nr:thiamine pyrophosphate-dependent dehydrogenase E1 component subunit alpha [Pseudomonadales bacterium]
MTSKESTSLTSEQLLDAYRSMKTIREFEERVNVEFTNGNIPGFVHLYTGQEAVAVGACIHLNDQDYISSTHRGHGHCIAKGCDVHGMMLEIMAKQGGLCAGKGGSMHIADMDKGMLGANAIVGGGPPITVGAAMTCKAKGQQQVSLCFTGDGGSNQGTTFEAMNLAVVLKLPVIFVFENNGYGEGTHASYAVGSPDIASRSEAFGMPAEKVDGTDFLAVEQAMKRAIDRARNGEGPSTIECDVVRFHGHFVGDAQLYRGENEIQDVRRKKDCLANFRRDLSNDIQQDEFEKIDSDVSDLIEGAVSNAMDAPPPLDSELETDVYVSYQ